MFVRYSHLLRTFMRYSNLLRTFVRYSHLLRTFVRYSLLPRTFVRYYHLPDILSSFRGTLCIQFLQNDRSRKTTGFRTGAHYGVMSVGTAIKGQLTDNLILLKFAKKKLVHSIPHDLFKHYGPHSFNLIISCLVYLN